MLNRPGLSFSSGRNPVSPSRMRAWGTPSAISAAAAAMAFSTLQGASPPKAIGISLTLAMGRAFFPLSATISPSARQTARPPFFRCAATNEFCASFENRMSPHRARPLK